MPIDPPNGPDKALDETSLRGTADASPKEGQGDVGPHSGQRVSHYRLERRLGAGGMGQVYLATDLALGRPAAIKFLPDAFTPAQRERLFREGWASARMQHPAIATFYEAGESDGVAFIAMEYVHGRTLKEEIKKGPLSPQRAVVIASRLLEGLAHAHAAQVLHRDIKPANIMCLDAGGAKLLDFGLARHCDQLKDVTISSTNPDRTLNVDLDETCALPNAPTSAGSPDPLDGLTAEGMILGTLGYMSPEQLQGAAVDVRTDIFAIGAVLFETLTGQPAFPGASAADRIQSTLHRNPPSIELGGESAILNQIIQRAVSKQPSQRFQNASEMLRELRSLDTGREPASALSRVAVLDLENQTGMEQLDWLSSAIADQLTLQLQQIGLAVVPRSTVVAARSSVVGTEAEIGLHLGSRWLITGDYGMDDPIIDVRLRLIDVPAMQVELEPRAHAQLDQLVDRQHAIAAEILEHIQPGSRSTSVAGKSIQGPSVEAYEYYVRGRRELFQYGKASLDRAEEWLAKAVDLNPTYAQALASLAQIAGMRYLFSKDPKTLERAIELAQRSIQANGQLADPWIWLAYARSQQVFALHTMERQAEAAARLDETMGHIRRAMELDPESPMASYFAAAYSHLSVRFATTENERTARRRSALALYQRNLAIAPQSCWSWLGIGWVHLDLGNDTEAPWCLEEAVKLEPKVTPPTAGVAVFLGECLRRVGKLDAAREQCLNGLSSTEKTDHMYRDTFRGAGLCALGKTALDMQDTSAAEAAFRQAVLHLRGRTQARHGGQLLVQALAGLARCGVGPEPMEEALALFTSRQDYEFGWLWWGWDEITLLELARAARCLGRTVDADRFLRLALAAGSVEASSANPYPEHGNTAEAE